LLVGHGTRDPEGTDQFFLLADRLQQLAPSFIVQPTLLEFQQPTIAQGWENLINAGVKRIAVAPLLLFSAGHARQDIPGAVASVAKTMRSVPFGFALPLSRHGNVVQLACRRIQSVIAATDPELATTVLMVGRGSYDPCARSDMYVLQEVVAHRLRRSTDRRVPLRVETCFYAMAQPRLTDTLDCIASDGATSQVVVYPHLLFEGRLNQAIHDQVADVAVKFPRITFKVAEYLGPEADIAQAIIQRAAVAIAEVG
jgi:sirohydrochlorin cobaltochelatase